MPLDLDDLYRLLRSAHVQAQGVLDTVRDPLLVLDAGLCVLDANPAFYRTFETCRDDTVGIPFYELGDGQWNIDALRQLLEQVIPKSAAVIDYEVTAAFPAVGHRTMLVSAERIAQPDNARRVLLLTIVDATERRRCANRQNFLIGELNHRIKNILTVTQALARQTSVKGRTAEEYRDAFLGRFEALGKILEVTSRADTAELPTLAHKVLEPYVGKRGAVVLEKGPTVALNPSQAMALGMIFHELATNALKYGALSSPEGKVTIAWNVDDGDDATSAVNLRWRESGGPRITPPAAGGFGTRLIEFSAEQDLCGRVEQDYDPDGLIVTLSFPRG